MLENSSYLNISINSSPNWVILTYSESPELALQLNFYLPYMVIYGSSKGCFEIDSENPCLPFHKTVPTTARPFLETLTCTPG